MTVSEDQPKSPLMSAVFYMLADLKSYINEYGLYVLNDQIDARKAEIAEAVENFDVVVFVKEGVYTGILYCTLTYS